MTDKKFPGNPTRSYRSRDPLRILGEVTDWTRLTPGVLQPGAIAWRRSARTSGARSSTDQRGPHIRTALRSGQSVRQVVQ